MGSCFSANKKHVRTNRQSYNGTQKIVGGNIMQNMTLEFDEAHTREQATRLSKRESRKSINSGRLPLYDQTKNGRIDQRKSIIEIANKELVDFSMDQDKLKEIKKQRKQSRAFNTEHINRRQSVSTTVVSESPNMNRRFTLFVDGNELGDIDEEEDTNQLRQVQSNMSNRRASFQSRRNSTVFNFDPGELPSVNGVDLNAQPKRSALKLQ